MKKHFLLILILAIVFVGFGMAFYSYYKDYQGVWPAVLPSKKNIAQVINSFNEKVENKNVDIPDAVNETDFPLTLPKGFQIAIFAADIPGARSLAKDETGNIWVSQSGSGKITRLETKDGKMVSKSSPYTGRTNPHGLAFDPQNPNSLYFAETAGIYKVDVSTQDTPQKIVDLPNQGGHNRRSIAFGPDGRLYVGIGSTCNVCYETNEKNATVYSMNPDGSDFRQVAKGLRNAAFLKFRSDGKLWVTENGRDRIGDDIPPDEINIVSQGNDYGWPVCFGKNVHDDFFDPQNKNSNVCLKKTISHIDIQAHSAPLGLGFFPDADWPEEYQGDLLVSYHGSWNRTIPTGYKVVHYDLDEAGNVTGSQDFISGWLDGKNALGRPVDILMTSEAVYVSDDKAGVIYSVTWQKPA